MFIKALLALTIFIGNIFAQTHLSEPETWEQILSGAKNQIDILAPAVFSPSFVTSLKKQEQRNIPIRILLDSSYLDDPENLIPELNENFRLRVIPKAHFLPCPVVLIDKNNLYTGSDLSGNLLFPIISSENKSTVDSYYERFLSLWKSCSDKETESLLKSILYKLEEDTITTESKSQAKVGTETKAEEGSFMASRYSSVYHKIDSPSAKRINPSNRIYFVTEEEARATGRRRAKNF
jgi:hypothetical protein